MSSRKDYLLRPSNYTTKMSCSESSSGHSFLVDSLISGRAEGSSHYYQSSGVYLPPSSEYSYGLSNCSYLPGFKRNDSHNMVPTSSPYVQGMESWLETSRSCRAEQPGHQIHPRSFSTAIKEENSYCLYESEKGPKDMVTEDISYSRVTQSSCQAGNNSVPAPGYFRLSQTYSAAKGYPSDDRPDSVQFLVARLDEAIPAVPSEARGAESREPTVCSPCAPATEKESRRSPGGPASSPEPPESGTDSPEKANKG